MTGVISLSDFAGPAGAPASPPNGAAPGIVPLEDFAGPPPAQTVPPPAETVPHMFPAGEAFKDFSDQATRAATMGLADKTGALVPAINSYVGNSFKQAMNMAAQEHGMDLPFPDLDKAPSFSDTYHAALAKERGAGETYAKDNPTASKIATTIGTVASVPLTGTAGAAKATLGGRVLQGAGQGATLGGLAGFGGSNDQSIASTALDTAEGAGTGAVLGAAAPVVAEKGVQPVLDWFGRKFGSEAANSQAVRAIADTMRQDEHAGGPTAQNMLDLLNAAPGKPQTLADVAGENTKGKLGSMLRQPGEARQAGTQFLNERDVGAGTRLSGDVDANISAGGSAFDTTQGLMEARSQAANPLYQKFDDAGVVHSDRLQQFIDQPEMRNAFQQGVQVQRLESVAQGKPFDPNAYTLQPGPDGLPVPVGVPNMRTLDAGKRGLDAMIAAERNDVTGRLSQKGVALDQFRRAYLGELDKLNPDYAAARAAWSGPSASMDAVRSGQGIFSKKPEEIGAEFGKLAPNDQEFYRLGAADAIKEKIAKTGMGGDEAKRIIGNQYTQDQLRAIFPSQPAYQKFIDAATAENRMFQTRFDALGGAQTAGRVAQDHAGASQAMGHAVQTGLSAGEGALGSAAFSAARTIGAMMNGGNNPQVNAAATRMLLNPDPAANRALMARILTNQNAPTALPLFSRPAITTGAQFAPALIHGYQAP